MSLIFIFCSPKIFICALLQIYFDVEIYIPVHISIYRRLCLYSFNSVVIRLPILYFGYTSPTSQDQKHQSSLVSFQVALTGSCIINVIKWVSIINCQMPSSESLVLWTYMHREVCYIYVDLWGCLNSQRCYLRYNIPIIVSFTCYRSILLVEKLIVWYKVQVLKSILVRYTNK